MLIITDLDDTLLNEKEEITAYTKKILDNLRKLGHLIIYNTARGYHATLPIYNQYQPDYLIINGGATIYDKNLKLLDNQTFGEKVTKEIITYLRNNKIKTILVETNAGFLCDDKDFVTEYPYATYKNLSDDTLNSCKIVFKDTNDDNARYLSDKYNLNFVNYVGGNLYKLSITTKADGIRNLKKILNSDFQTICFGDDKGDIEMLLEADYGIRMKNSQKILFNYDFYETKYSNNEDGVARYLSEFCK